MAANRVPQVEIEGQTIKQGTSLFDTIDHSVYWFVDAHGGYVELEGLDGRKRVTKGQFAARLRNRTFIVEDGSR